MNTWTILVTVFGLIALGELGDKTNFLSITLACKYPWKPVLAGIVVAVAVLMGIAVLVGETVLSLLPPMALKLIAGALFLFFALKSFLEKEKGEEEKVHSSASPFWATFLSFFLGELGDKTQLLTLALAAQYQQPLPVWLGASLAMIVVDGTFVFIGNRLGRLLPRRILRYVAGTLFAVFGLLTILSAFLPGLSF
ncbi:MAG: TMEM165/GDT1 family protein [Coprothermobacterota bacterium]|nr:TMEM165/GDT1 family protein [Coprothermobacterota bacterium]